METIALAEAHLQFLTQLSRELNPTVAEPFGRPHAIRTLLEGLEEAELDLSGASSEEEIARVAAAALRARRGKR